MASAGALPVLILTGLSGAGKSTALKVFEDLGFFCVDGLPASMVPKLVSLFGERGDSKYRGLALGMDLRQVDFLDQWQRAEKELADMDVLPRIIFLEAKADILLRRYATTRRPHPLESFDLGLEQALEKERNLLAPMRNSAELVVDTSLDSVHDLRRKLQEKWSAMREKTKGLRIHVISFGFKYGAPSEADLVFDLRFLPNPYFDEALRPMSGMDAPIAEYVLGSEPGSEFLQKLMDFLLYLLPLYAEEGRYRLTLALGCTGGRHRSVAVSEATYKALREAGYAATLEHRHCALG